MKFFGCEKTLLHNSCDLMKIIFKNVILRLETHFFFLHSGICNKKKAAACLKLYQLLNITSNEILFSSVHVIFFLQSTLHTHTQLDRQTFINLFYLHWLLLLNCRSFVAFIRKLFAILWVPCKLLSLNFVSSNNQRLYVIDKSHKVFIMEWNNARGISQKCLQMDNVCWKNPKTIILASLKWALKLMYSCTFF